MLEHLLEKAPDAFDVTIFNAEPRVNYDRIMLSPVLSGEKSFDEIIIHGDGWYIEHGIMLYKGHKIVEIDRSAKTVRSEHGEMVSYDKLVIAIGSLPYIIPVPGNDLAGVLTYRDLDDVQAMMLVAKSCGNAVVIGGGLLGLEAAAGLMEQGMTAGAGMAFMVAGAVSSIPAMTAVFALVNHQVFVAYVALGFVGAVTSGVLFQTWLAL